MAAEERLDQIIKAGERSNQNFALITEKFDELAAKKPRIDRSLLEFKSRGNEDQFTFN